MNFRKNKKERNGHPVHSTTTKQILYPNSAKFTLRTLYMQAFGPPEKAANTMGNGLTSTSCIASANKNKLTSLG